MDNGTHSLTNAILEQSADIKRVTSMLERSTFQQTRMANASEDSNALVLNEAREARLANERAVEAFEKVPVALMVLAVAVQAAATQSIEAKTEARRAADNSRTAIPLPRHYPDEGGSATAVSARRALRDILNAPGRSQLVVLALVVIAAVTLLGYFAIKNGVRADRLEHEGTPIERARGHRPSPQPTHQGE